MCPLCGQSDQVEKASTIYLVGIGLKGKTSDPESKDEALISSPVLGAIPAPGMRALSKRLSPPTSRAQAFTRPVHPDIAVLAFSLITPIFLFGIYTSQIALLLPVLAILVGFYAIYFWKRKTLIARFERQIADRKASNDRTQRGVRRWMNLYYCMRDDIVFEPGKSEGTPVDQMPGYLFKE
jgi:hypothetical protein